MANATIYPNSTSTLSWSSSSSTTAITEDETTIVTNSFGSRVYWWEGANNGSIGNNKTLTCTQGPIQKTWVFSNQSSGGPQITLTISSSGGGGAPPPAAQGQGGAQGKGQGQAKKG